MINALTRLHTGTVQVGNAVASLLVAHINRKLRLSSDRASKAETLKANVIKSVAIIRDKELLTQKSLLVNLKTAHKLVNA